MDGDSEDEEFYDASDHPSIVLTSSETQSFYRHDLQNLGLVFTFYVSFLCLYLVVPHQIRYCIITFCRKEFDSSCVLNDFEAKVS